MVTAVAAGDRWPERLHAAFSPALSGALASAPVALDLFVTPPAYTDRPPIFLRAGATDTTAASIGAPAEPISVPEGSAVLARVTAPGAVPTLLVNGEALPFSTIDERSFEGAAVITGGTEIAVTRGSRTLGAWPIHVVPDGAPAATERSAVQLAYAAADDYGIATVTATVALAEGEVSVVAVEPVILDLTVREAEPGQAAGIGYFDLTPHVWAGRPVTLTLTATDEAGQTGRSAPADFVLPERVFTHPIARAIIEQRRALLTDPSSAADVAGIIGDLSLRPSRFGDDAVVFLALRSAAHRLTLTHDPLAEVNPVQMMLWDTALRIEEGDLLLAERALREAQQALMDALADEATSDDEIARLMDELRQAMDRYMQALQQSLLDQVQAGDLTALPFDPEAELFDRNTLQELLEDMQDLSEAGARDAAMEMLAELQAMMESLNTGQVSEGAASAMQQAMQQAMQILEDLQRLSEAQQALLDQTFADSQDRQRGEQSQGDSMQPGQGPNGQAPGSQPGARPGETPSGNAAPDGAATQEALRRALGALMPEIDGLIGEIPSSLGQAEQAMRRSTDALQRGRPGGAVDPQGQAVDQIQQGIQDIVNALMDQMAQQGGGGPMLIPGGMNPTEGHDPLGRATGRRGFSTEHVEVPTESEVQRTRAILDELRRRLGERSRPELELDYLERLLDRF